MLFNPGRFKIIRTSTTSGPRTWQSLLSNTQHQHLGECSVKHTVPARSSHSCFLQHNITVIADPGRFKFQFLCPETPPCPAYCWQKLWPRLLPMGSSRCISSLKKRAKKAISISARLFIASQTQMANSSGRLSPARGLCCHTHVDEKSCSGGRLLQLLSSLAGKQSGGLPIPLPDPSSFAPRHGGEVGQISQGLVRKSLKSRWSDHLSHPTLIHTCPQAER